MTLIAIESVSKRFGDVVALDGVSVDIAGNEFFSLLGPSGCGKTTLLRILAGFEQPDSGRVVLDGVDLSGVKPYRRPVNMMFQSYALFPHMSVRRNVAFGLEEERLPAGQIRERVDEALAKVGLEAMGERRPHQLSGGQRQRVALARAVVKRPKVLLLDEPLGALDRKIRAEMQLELKRLQHEVGITFVVVTHDQEEAMSMADRIAVMHEGHVLQVASPVELYERPATHFVADFIGEMNFLPGAISEGLFDVPGIGRFLVTDPDQSGDWLGVRPEKLTIGSHSTNRLTGTVVDVSFYGALTHCLVEVAGLEQSVRVNVSGPLQLPAGAPVTVGWDPADAVVLSR